MSDTICMDKPTTKQRNGGNDQLPTVKVTKQFHALILRIGNEADEPTQVVLERLLPIGRLEQELQKVLREKREAIDRELKGLDKRK